MASSAGLGVEDVVVGFDFDFDFVFAVVGEGLLCEGRVGMLSVFEGLGRCWELDSRSL